MIIECTDDTLHPVHLIQQIRQCIKGFIRVYWDRQGDVRIVPWSVLENWSDHFGSIASARREGMSPGRTPAIRWSDKWTPIHLDAINPSEALRVSSRPVRLRHSSPPSKARPTP